MQFKSSDWYPAIDCAVLRDDGRIHLQINGVSHQLHQQPTDTQQIALTRLGLSRLDSDGAVFHLSCEPTQFRWERDQGIELVAAIGTLVNGNLCATTHDGQVMQLADDGWQSHASLTDWVSQAEPNHASRSRSRWRLSRKISLVLVGLVFAGVLWHYLAKVRELQQAVRVLTAGGCNVVYAHQVKSNGTIDPNAKPPGPEWLRRLIGDDWFTKPIHLTRENGSYKVDLAKVSKLPTLQQIDLRFVKTIDVAVFKSLKELTRLHFETAAIQNVSALGELKSLKDLSILNADRDQGPDSTTAELINAVSRLYRIESLRLRLKRELSDLTPLKNLTGLRHLEISCPGSCGFAPLTGLSQLQSLGATVKDLRPIGKLRALQSLDVTIGVGARRRDLAELGELTQLRKLRVRGQNGATDGAWLSGLSKLQELMLFETDLTNQDSLRTLGHLRQVVLPTKALDVELLKSTRLKRSHYQDSSRFKLGGCNVTDLEFLVRSPTSDLQRLYHLELDQNPLSDIQLLGQLPRQLSSLDISDTNVGDISCLSGSPLNQLRLARSRVSDLTAVSSMKDIALLDASELEVDQVEFHPEARDLFDLRLAGTKVSDLTKISLPQRGISTVDLSNTPVQDLEPIRNWPPVGELNLSGTKVSDISALVDQVWLRHLDLSNTNVSNLVVLKNLPRLEQLSLADTNVRDLSPLRELIRLKSLDLSRTRVSRSELELLSELPKLREITLDGLPISDLSMLSEKAIGSLDISNTNVKSLTSLRSAKTIGKLRACNTNLDLQFLRVPAEESNRLSSLDLGGCPIERLDADLLDSTKRLHYVRMDCQSLQDLSPLSQLKNLSEIELQNVNSQHRFDWLSQTRVRKLTLTGKPFDLSNLHNGLSRSWSLAEIRLPLGTEIDYDKHSLLKTVLCVTGQSKPQ